MRLSPSRGGTAVAWAVLDGGDFAKHRRAYSSPTPSVCRSADASSCELESAPCESLPSFADAWFARSTPLRRSSPIVACKSAARPTGSSNRRPLHCSAVQDVVLPSWCLTKSNASRRTWARLRSKTRSLRWRWRASRQCCRRRQPAMRVKPRVIRPLQRNRKKSMLWRIVSKTSRQNWNRRRRMLRSWRTISSPKKRTANCYLTT
mmetsp:Transcript_146/g.323  ORF Transcript_146/g.323 Transcript_146/m.323 type:complete len:205 (-) Transcript_146:1767-2381(-)